jgi:spoIIIJ-associated protein
MSDAEISHEILDTMLGHLGFAAHIDSQDTPNGPVLQVSLEHAEILVGAQGERLDDLQYLVNRLLQVRSPDAPRVRVDVAHFREMREDQFVEHIRTLADRVRASGHPVKLEPMNSYQRRLVHNALVNDPDVKSWSPEDSGRLKRITLMPRNAATPPSHPSGPPESEHH